MQLSRAHHGLFGLIYQEWILCHNCMLYIVFQSHCLIDWWLVVVRSPVFFGLIAFCFVSQAFLIFRYKYFFNIKSWGLQWGQQPLTTLTSLPSSVWWSWRRRGWTNWLPTTSGPTDPLQVTRLRPQLQGWCSSDDSLLHIFLYLSPILTHER